MLDIYLVFIDIFIWLIDTVGCITIHVNHLYDMTELMKA